MKNSAIFFELESK